MPTDRPTVASVLALAREYLDEKAKAQEGISLSMMKVLKGAMKDRDLTSARRYCELVGDTHGAELASLMLQLTMTGRNKVIRSLDL